MPRATSYADQPRCVELASVFQNPLLDGPPATDAGVPQRQYNRWSRRPSRPASTAR
jgi:hypothetical protein